MSIVGPDRLLYGVVGGFAARIVAPGQVEHLGWDRLRVGEHRGGPVRPPGAHGRCLAVGGLRRVV